MDDSAVTRSTARRSRLRTEEERGEGQKIKNLLGATSPGSSGGIIVVELNYCKKERRGERKKGKRREKEGKKSEGEEKGNERSCNFDYY
jgi:hypothetical protein